MKYCLLPLLLCLALASCAQPKQLDHQPGRIIGDDGYPVVIDPTKPPNGIHIVQILLENQSLSVKGTGCESGSEDKSKLQHTLAMVLGDVLDSPHHRTELSAGCIPDRYELSSGKMIDAWQCKLSVVLSVVEKDEKGEDIASANIRFGITKDTWEIIPVPRALTCT